MQTYQLLFKPVGYFRPPTYLFLDAHNKKFVVYVLTGAFTEAELLAQLQCFNLKERGCNVYIYCQ